MAALRAETTGGRGVGGAGKWAGEAVVGRIGLGAKERGARSLVLMHTFGLRVDRWRGETRWRGVDFVSRLGVRRKFSVLQSC